MKCIDVTMLLDGRIEAAPAAAEGAAIDAHAAGCGACADQRAAARHVAGFRADVPALPETLLARARQLEDQLDGSPQRSPTRRPVLIGSLLLLGAAATMFSVIPREEDTATA